MTSSTHRIGVLKRDGVGKKYFDMENLLTRSLYRVMNNSTKVPPELTKTQNVDKFVSDCSHSSIGIARPNNHRIGNSPEFDKDIQLRLLAQEVCGRVEKRYERKLEQVRDNDRKQIDKRLASIRAEYDAKYQIQLGKLEKEKTRLADQYAEKERNMENKLEMRVAEKEHDIESRRRMMENRVSEVMLSKQNLDKMKEDWRKKMDMEMEQIKLEREKVSMDMMVVSSREKSDQVLEQEVRIWKKRAQDLENDADMTRKKLAEMMTENFKLTDQLTSMNPIKRELELALSSLEATREELTASRLENRRTGDYDRLKEENDSLRLEIERIRLQNSQRTRDAVDEVASEFAIKDEKYRRAIGQARIETKQLNDKCLELKMERDVLKNELKSMQKMVSKGNFAAPTSRRKLPSFVPRIVNQYRPASPTESTSSSLSDGEMELLKIRQRIQNLEDVAKDLDASVEHISIVNNASFKGHSPDENVEQYDDFCRALHRSSVDKNLLSPITSSPQKPKNRREVREEIEEQEENPERLRKSTRMVSPPKTKTIHEEVRKEERILIKEEVPVKEEVKEVPVVQEVKPELSAFEKRLQQQAIDQANRRARMMELAEMTKEAEKKEPVVVEQSKTTSADNPMFSGVDPVMADYMKQVMANRGGGAQSSTSAIEKPKEVEISLADELELDDDVGQIETSTKNDDDWW